MTQTKKMSLTESIVNTALGFIISLILINWLLPTYGYEIKTIESFEITSIFTAVSVVRSYLVRRFFNYVHIGG